MFIATLRNLMVTYSTLNQTDLMRDLFDSAWLETGRDITSVSISKWATGKTQLPNWLTNYYVSHPGRMEEDIKLLVFHSFYDAGRLALELDKLIAEDPCISPQLKAKMRAAYPYNADDEQIALIAACLLYAMKRPVKLAPIA